MVNLKANGAKPRPNKSRGSSIKQPRPMDHTPGGLGKYVCKHCNRPFKTMDAFVRHLAEKHGIKFHEK